MSTPAESPSTNRSRVLAACDQCKSRKVKCDGGKPCSACRRRKCTACHYSPAKRPRVEAQAPARSPFIGIVDLSNFSNSVAPQLHSQSQRAGPNIDEEETLVPREARLLQDSQGKLIFIGDCAPLSFLQTVRHLVTSCVDGNVFISHFGQDPMLEQADSRDPAPPKGDAAVGGDQFSVETTIATFLWTTSGLVDIFEPEDLYRIVNEWYSSHHKADNVHSAVILLILAIGLQSSNVPLASHYFHRAREIALLHLGSDTSLAIVQAFLLIALYMLRGCQANGAFLYFGLAARASYSIGMHRTEVNARFGKGGQRLRERLYKSLKVVDLFISIQLGRPPALYDLDCTVPYKTSRVDMTKETDCLDDTLQILLIVETIVMEVYSRRKISSQLTNTISHRLKGWASQRLSRLLLLVTPSESTSDLTKVIGACQALATYYYAIMLVSKPFLMYEVYRRLAEANGSNQSMPKHAHSSELGRAKLAEGCIDAACCLVDMISNFTQDGQMPHKMPLIVSWLFTASLVLGVGLLGGFGRLLERNLVESVCSLEFFAEHDPHALQYSLIQKSLLSTALDYLQKKELNERVAKEKSSSELFGLIPGFHKQQRSEPDASSRAEVVTDIDAVDLGNTAGSSDQWDDLDLSLYGNELDDVSHDIFGTLNLFPISETGNELIYSNIT